jgi:hypothetical protein
VGDRAVFVCRDETGYYSPGIYIHLGGSQALDYLLQAAPKMPADDVSYAAARLCGVLHQIISGSDYLALLPPPEVDTQDKVDWDQYSHGDAGVVIVNVSSGTAECVAGYLAGRTLQSLPFKRQSTGRDAMMAELAERLRDPLAEATVAELIETLHDPSWLNASSAAERLATMTEAATEAIPVMMDLLSSPDVNIRCYMAVALGEFGPLAIAAVDRMVPLLEDPGKCWFQDEPDSYPVRFRVAFAIAKIDPRREETYPVIREALNCDHGYARSEARHTLRILSAAAVEFDWGND